MEYKTTNIDISTIVIKASDKLRQKKGDIYNSFLKSVGFCRAHHQRLPMKNPAISRITITMPASQFITGIPVNGPGAGGAGTGVPVCVGTGFVVLVATSAGETGVLTGVPAMVCAGCNPDAGDTVASGVAFATGFSRLSETAKYEKPGVEET